MKSGLSYRYLLAVCLNRGRSVYANTNFKIRTISVDELSELKHYGMCCLDYYLSDGSLTTNEDYLQLQLTKAAKT